MEAKVGDRVSVDAKKVGQPRRAGVIKAVSKGLSGARYQVRWDDGQESMLAPGAGNLVVEGGRNGKGAAKKRAPSKGSKKKTAKRKR